MILAILVAMLAWTVSILRTRSFKKAAQTGFVAGGVTFAICLIVAIISTAITM